jgi:hypothetical protein
MKTICLVGVLLAFNLTACGEKQDPFGGGDGGVDGEVTYGNQIGPLLEANCVPCHDSAKSGAERNGAPLGVDFDNYTDAKNSALGANTRIQAGTMPPTGAPSTGDKALFQAWVDQGMKE